MSDLPEKILVIDDSESFLTFISAALEPVRDGLQVRACMNCDDAIIAVNDNEYTPDLILLDLKMPEKDGVETISELRSVEHVKKTPIIFLTGDERIKMEDRFKLLGIIGVIHKPGDAEKIVNEIKDIWKQKDS